VSELPGVIADGGLELVPHDPSFSEAYLAVVLRNLDRLARWEPWAQTTPTLASIRTYQQWAASRAATGAVAEFAIRLDGEIVGSTGARLGEGRVEFGYWIDADVEGHGVARRAVELLLGQLEALGRTALEAHTGEENARSIRLLERLGFSRSDEPLEPLRLGERLVPMIRFVRG